MGSLGTVSHQRRVSHLRYRAIGLGAAASVIPLAAGAQAPPAPSSALEEVIVTARRVEENLQDTPIAVSVFSGDALTERQVFATTELDQVVPNLQFANNAPLAGNNASSQVFIRGIGQTDPTSTVDPGVGLYIDNVYIGSAVGGAMGLRDIQSIQVLRGPQGTLFGRNTTSCPSRHPPRLRARRPKPDREVCCGLQRRRAASG
jgi:iron complex outermembrane receptor protein